MKIQFSSIRNDPIFNESFQHLVPQYGTIEFRHKQGRGGIAVVYAPNGVGKTTLVNTLNTTQSSATISFTATDDTGREILPQTNVFHCILDEVNRNVIPGTETDYLIGDQIRREYALRERIKTLFADAFTRLLQMYKNDYKVSRVNDYLLEQLNSQDRDNTSHNAYEYIRNIVNPRTHGSSINREELIIFLRSSSISPILLDDEKRRFIIECSSKTKIIDIIRKIKQEEFVCSVEALEIEKHDDAIFVLDKYPHMHTCVVCDNDNIDGDSILDRKKECRQHIYDSLDEKTRNLLDKVVKEPLLTNFDPFGIRKTVAGFIAGDEPTAILMLQVELNTYVNTVCDEMIKALLACFDNTTMFESFDEYSELRLTQAELDEEELMYINDVIRENIDRSITISRSADAEHNYQLMLDDVRLVGAKRQDLKLSNGEQNFISLAFELLLARHSRKEYVVIDDPISSFDSVYKNKIAFCIVKFLEDKKQIILTHNIDLVRLLEVQLQGSYNLYILNNSDDGNNGFTRIGDNEKGLLINMHELIKLLQNSDNTLDSLVTNKRLFLMSIIPFLRGYAHISIDIHDYYGKLSSIMHGYSNSSIDITPIYKEFFGYDFSEQIIISTADILSIDPNTVHIFNPDHYPLLAETLRQTLIYYYLRMKVEKELVNIFQLSFRENDPITLNDIIQRAFRASPSDLDYADKRAFRVFFSSRKTLLNEFNHFEGNMNIFQPAIDIEADALRKEINDIERKLSEVRTWHDSASADEHP